MDKYDMSKIEYLEKQKAKLKKLYDGSYSSVQRYHLEEKMDAYDLAISGIYNEVELNEWRRLDRKCRDKHGKGLAAVAGL